jgi:hypothetical protein
MGPLRFEVERFLTGVVTDPGNNVQGRNQVPWPALRDHVSASFLNVDEAAALREEVETVTQDAFETEAGYSRRFREKADAAYPAAQRNPDQNRILVKAYAKGLRSGEIARKLVMEGNPVHLEQAIQLVGVYSERAHAYTRLRRTEEPMEVNHVAEAAMVAPAATKVHEDLLNLQDRLLKSQERLQTRLAKLEAGQGSGRPKRNASQSGGARPPAWNQAGQPRCFQCQRYGHFARECSRKQGSGNAPAPQ